ncbi:MAG TPA: hypothetical protein VN214_12165, partial [Pseudomonas sp.]|nr:hypothetical protein [Pseudomonas sp.]
MVAFYQSVQRLQVFWGCFAAQREQALSPQDFIQSSQPCSVAGKAIPTGKLPGADDFQPVDVRQIS